MMAARIERGALDATRYPEPRYAVLGCGNSQWPGFQAFPKFIEDALKRTGASPILPRAEADGNRDFDGAIERWLGQLWKALGGAGVAAALERPCIAVAYKSDAAINSLPCDTLYTNRCSSLIRRDQ